MYKVYKSIFQGKYTSYLILQKKEPSYAYYIEFFNMFRKREHRIHFDNKDFCLEFLDIFDTIKDCKAFIAARFLNDAEEKRQNELPNSPPIGSEKNLGS